MRIFKVTNIFVLFFITMSIHYTAKSQTTTFNKQSAVLFKSVNGSKLRMDIYYPKAEDVLDENPWVLFVHGGGWAGGDRFNVLKSAFLGTLENLLDSGVVVASIDYRLAKAGSGNTSYHSTIDCKDAAKFLLKNAQQYKLDTVEYGVWGGSAGGHLGLLTALAPDSSFVDEASIAGYPLQFKFALAFYPFTS